MTLRNLLCAFFLPIVLAACANQSSPNIVATVDPLAFQAPAVPTATAGAAYSFKLEAVGGQAPYVWSLAAGALPSGVTLSSAGLLAGAAAATGEFSFTPKVTDSSAPRQTASAPAVLQVVATTLNVSKALPDATVGASYAATLSATGGKLPYTWSLASGTLPAGLVINPNGSITGVATAPGSASFTVSVRDSSSPAISQTESLGIIVRVPPPPALAITTTSFTPGTIGTPYFATLAASGGLEGYTWTVAAGALPAGLTLSGSGVISGTPTATGTSSFTIQVADSGKPANSATRTLTLTIAGTALAIATASLPAGSVSTSYNAVLIGTGGTQPYKWSIAAGSLPLGLVLSTAGTLSGTPTTPGSSNFTVQLRDSASPVNVVTRALSITVSAPPLLIVTAVLTSGQINVAYNATLAGQGGTTPYTWSLKAGRLPAGLSLSSAGVISGTPTAAGSSGFTVQLADAGTLQQVATRALTLNINSSSLSISTSSLPDGVVGATYNAQLAATGGTPPYTWSVQPSSLPTGLTLSAGGLLTGTPTSTDSSDVTFKVVDSAATPLTAVAPLTIRINPPTLAVSTSALAAGTVGTPYGATLAATGGTAPYRWTIVSGAPQAGLTLATDGTLSGTATTAGTSSFTVQVSDTQSPAATATRSLTLTINPASFNINTTSLASGQVGNAYSATLDASGGSAPYSWSLGSGTLPAGLTLSSGGVILGTPTAAGTSSFIVRVTDAQAPAAVATRALSLTIAPPSLVISTNTVPAGTESSLYSTTLAASGGTTPYTWTLAAGALPAGLNLSSAGVISGTPSAQGTAFFTVRVTDSQSPAASATRALSIATSASPIVINTTSLASAAVSVPYSATLSAGGGVTPYNWSLTAGTLPPGLSLSAAGVISGTPSTAANVSITIQVTDSQSPARSATQTLSLVVNAATLQVATTSLANGTVAVAYNTTLSATGGTTPYSWSIASGSLPAGLTLSSGGVVTGTPTVAGINNLTVQVTDSGSPANTATRPFTLTMVAAPLAVTTSSLPNGSAGSAYSASLTATGGTLPYSWSIVSGALPGGLSLSAAGVLSGTPIAPGSSSFTVQVVDSQTPTHNATQAFTLSISPTALAVSTASLPDGIVGSAYSAALAATGGVTPYSWVLASGALPAGLSMSTTGIISGTPSAAGSSSFTARVTDAQSATTTRSFTLVVTPTVLVITTTSPLPSGQAGSAYSTTLAATGGTVPYLWSLASGSLPEGLTLSVGGVISGTPSASGAGSFTIEVSDAQLPAHNTTQNFTLTIAPAPLVITTPSLPQGTAGTAYSATLAATGGISPYAWSLASGALPAGLSLSTAGVISGTPGAGGTSSFTVQVVDAQLPSHNNSQALTLTIRPGGLSVSTTSLTNGSVGAAYSASLAAAGGTPPYSWSIVSGALPTGLTLSAAGQITGTPATPGTTSFTVQATDSQGSPATATRALTLSVNAAPLSVVTTTLPNGTIGTAYSATLAATGGAAPYSWTIISGALPAGLSLSSGGVISGTPSAALPASFTVKITDSQLTPATDTRALTLTTFGRAALSWTAPSQNDDGSDLTPNGYWIFYGTGAGSLTNSQQVANPSAIGGIVNGLTAGTWYFSVTAYDRANVQSIRTNVFSVAIP